MRLVRVRGQTEVGDSDVGHCWNTEVRIFRLAMKRGRGVSTYLGLCFKTSSSQDRMGNRQLQSDITEWKKMSSAFNVQRSTSSFKLQVGNASRNR